MNKRILGLLFVFILAIIVPSVSAQNSADYQVIDNSVLVELNFEKARNLELKLPFDAKAFEINLGKENYEINEFDRYKLIKISSADNLKIKYITNILIDKSKRGYLFILKRPTDEKINITLYLPDGAVLIDAEQSLVLPAPTEISTDGRRIIIKWSEFDSEQIVAAYEFIEKQNFIYYTIIAILIVCFVALYYFNSSKLKQKLEQIRRKGKISKEAKKEKEVTKNLFEDEKIIVEYLLIKKDNECWTKELVHDLKISKVKLSRKLRSLEQKEIIKRIPYGNENRIRLQKSK